MIKLQSPLEDFSWSNNCSQLFGVNRELYEANFNIPGHNGLDFFKGGEKQGYGEKVLASHDGRISRLNYETTWRTSGNGVYLQSPDGTFETVYWHLSEIQCFIGQEIKQGDIIGLTGNTGFVRPEPTSLQPYNGSHLHFGLRINGKQNEYGDFVDPTPCMIKEGDRLPLYFARDLYWGCSGDDVSWLQTCLKILLGEEVKFEPIGYFGIQTLLAIRKLQQKFFIFPSLGYVGTKTRHFLVERLSIWSWGCPPEYGIIKSGL